MMYDVNELIKNKYRVDELLLDLSINSKLDEICDFSSVSSNDMKKLKESFNKNCYIYPSIIKNAKILFDEELCKKTNPTFNYSNIQRNMDMFLKIGYKKNELEKYSLQEPKDITELDRFLKFKFHKKGTQRASIRNILHMSENKLELLQNLTKLFNNVKDIYYIGDKANIKLAVYILIYKFGMDETYFKLPYGYQSIVPDITFPIMVDGKRVLERYTEFEMSEELIRYTNSEFKEPAILTFMKGYSFEKNILAEQINNIVINSGDRKFFELLHNNKNGYFNDYNIVIQIVAKLKEYNVTKDIIVGFINHFVLLKHEDFIIFITNIDEELRNDIKNIGFLMFRHQVKYNIYYAINKKVYENVSNAKFEKLNQIEGFFINGEYYSVKKANSYFNDRLDKADYKLFKKWIIRHSLWNDRSKIPNHFSENHLNYYKK